MNKLITDEPLSAENKDADILGYADLAKNWAEIIYDNIFSSKNLTFSIEAPWEQGKTSISNYIEHYLLQIHRDKNINDYSIHPDRYLFKENLPIWNSQRILMVHRINPWSISNVESIVLDVFKILQDTPDMHNRNSKKLLLNIMEYLMPIIHDSSPASIQTITRTVSNLLTYRTTSEDTLESSIDKIKVIFNRNDTMKFIIIDDIDRMEEKEILLVLKITKILSGLKGVHFLLIFDRDALTTQCTSIKNSYLEKFINYRFEIPKPSNYNLVRYVFSQVDTIIPDTMKDAYNAEKIQLYSLGSYLSQDIGSIRQAKILINRIKSSLSHPDRVGLNPVDIIVFEVIKFYAPEVADKDSLKEMNRLTNNPLVNPLVNQCLNILNDDRRHGNMLFKSFQYINPYKNNTTSILETLSRANIENPDPMMLLEGIDNNSKRDIAIDLIYSDYFSPNNLVNPLLFSFTVYKTIFSRIDSQDYSTSPYFLTTNG